MTRRFLTACGIAVAIIVALAVPAFASGMVTQLNAYVDSGYYGQDCVLHATSESSVTPTPGDKVELQVYTKGVGWEKFGEEQLVEETGTVDPFYIQINESLPSPAKFRAIYYDKQGSLVETGTPSDYISLYARKFACNRTIVGVPTYGNVGKSFTAIIRMAQNPGPGKVGVRVYHKRNGSWVLVKSTVVSSDDMGTASFKYRPAAKGAYRVRAVFGGNRFSVAGYPGVDDVVVR